MYKFNPDDAKRFAKEQGIKYRVYGNELRLKTCPYCRSSRDKDTFAINLDTGMFKCLRASCGAHGNMISLHKDFNFSLGNDINEYYDRERVFRTIPKRPKPEPENTALEYMRKRGISRRICEEYHITADKKNKRILVFPFYDENDELVFIKYRNMDFDPEKDHNKEWCMRDTKPILFGMAQCDMTDKRLIMTEGQIDSLSVAEAGYKNVVSVPTGKNGFSWVPYCWDFLGKFEELLIFGDREGNSITLLDEMAARFHGTVYHVRPEDYKGCKDANEILQKYGPEAIDYAIDHAVPVKIKEIKDITEVKKVNISDLEKINTGIGELNRILGGFYFGQVVLLTGERGKGKSTLASQFGTMAVKQGYSTFFYSGELLDWYFRNWIDLQIAGDRHINRIRNSYGSYDYTVDGSIYAQMEKWYAGKIKLYDCSILEEDEHRGLVETVEKAIKQYACRVIILDNLMTAMEDDITSDLNRQQTSFVRQLTLIAKRFNVLIILVAHPKKNQGGKYEFNNDDVAGSSNITNLVDVILRYDTPRKTDDEGTNADRILQVFKNRLTGKLETHGIELYFQESSKRISEHSNIFDWEMGWEGFHDADESLEIPF